MSLSSHLSSSVLAHILTFIPPGTGLATALLVADDPTNPLELIKIVVGGVVVVYVTKPLLQWVLKRLDVEVERTNNAIAGRIADMEKLSKEKNGEMLERLENMEELIRRLAENQTHAHRRADSENPR